MKTGLFFFQSLIFWLIYTSTLNAQTGNYPGTTLEFDGTDDYITIPNESDYDFTDSMTVEAWVKVNTFDRDWQSIVTKGDNAWRLHRYHFSNNFSFGTNGLSNIDLQGSIDVNDGQWHHVAAVYDGSKKYLYLDGALDDSVTVTGTISLGDYQVYIGENAQRRGRYFNGKIDEIRIWNKARTAQEIREHMNLPLSGTETGLISYWQFNDGSGTTLTDAAGSNDGTLTNMTDDDWVSSTIPFGSGHSDSGSESTGYLWFFASGIILDFNSQNGADITATLINTTPNVLPDEPDYVYSNSYWVVNRYGTGNFNADLTFYLNGNIPNEYSDHPSLIKLYTRGSNTDTAWTLLASANSVNTTQNTATFNGITGFGQFIVCRNDFPKIATLDLFPAFVFVTDNFNGIDVGDNASPTFTDLDGDGLLDLLVGEQAGNINYYEQNSKNSTSFTLVTENFNGIDVGEDCFPNVTDMDGDGLLDLFIGKNNGRISRYEQNAENSTSFTYITDDFNGIDVGDLSKPFLIDLDGDGLLDLIVGKKYGKLDHYEQNTVNSGSFTLYTFSFNGIDVGMYSAPYFTDMENDGVLEFFIGELDGYINLYRQDTVNSTSFSRIDENLGELDVGSNSVPAVTDFDGDELADMLIGERYGKIYYYEQEMYDSLTFGKKLTGNTYVNKYLIKAGNLAGNLNISCPAGYNISLSENSGYSQSLSIAPTNGRVFDTVFVRFQPSAEQEYPGTLTHTSAEADTVEITLTGEGVASPDNYPGAALDFDGTDDYVLIANEQNFDFINSMTVEVWIKVNAFDKDWQAVITKGDDAWRLHRYGSSNNLAFGTSGLSNVDMQGSTNVNDGKWHHIAAVYDGSNKYLYVDGKLDISVGVTGTLSINNVPVNIGQNGGASGRNFNGLIDEVRIWNCARTTEQIRENMNLPLSGNETGLVSYWQFNESSGTFLNDLISGNDGTLKNMSGDDWVSSNIPFGPGYSDSETEANGTVNFTNTGVSMNFHSQNGATVTVTRIDTVANTNPTGRDNVLDNQYWVVNRYGTGSFNADVTFTVSETIPTGCESNPSLLKLYRRGSTSYSAWTLVDSASSVNAANKTVTFDGIIQFGQFIICEDNLQDIVLLDNPYSLTFITGNFNGIDVGEFSGPAITDLDGDNLLDLLIGEWDGNINHYEQDNLNSTSFTLVTNNFNGILEGYFSKPAFTDLDGDGLLDLLIGDFSGNIDHYEQNSQNSTAFSQVTGNFNGIDVGKASAPTFTDLDGDGLLDMLVGEMDGNINHYEQNSQNSTSFTLITENFNGIDVGTYSSPVFTDLDGDALLDLLVGEQEGNINYYEQNSENSTSFTLVTENFNGMDVGDESAPCFTDLDGDKLLDLLVGGMDGNIDHYEQSGCDSIKFGNKLTGTTFVKNYFVKAKGLGGNLNISCPANFQISLSENSGYSQSLSISPTGGRVSDTVFVKFQPTAEQTCSGMAVHTSVGFDTVNIVLTGTGVKAGRYPGTALEFDGSDDYITISNESDYDFTDSMTIEAWIKVNAFNRDWQAIVTKGDNAWRLHRYYYSNNISFGTSGLSNGDLQGATNVNDGQWHHIAAVYDGSHKYLYVDGKLDASAAVTGTISVNDYPVNIGENAQQTGRYFDGRIEEVRIWNCARTAEEIRENMYMPLNDNLTGLISYWQFNDGSGTGLSDPATGNSGTLQNMTDDDWVSSTIPFGPGCSDSETETNGTVTFTNTGLSMNFNSQTGATVTVTRLDTTANINPSGTDYVFDNQYWVVNRYGSGSFNADLTFTFSENISTQYNIIPSSVKLYTRGTTADTSWSLLASAGSVDAAAKTVTFNGITTTGQFIICKNDLPLIASLEDPQSFTLITNYFNQINIVHDGAPAFTDLDEDELLDLLVGRFNGTLNYYEQNVVNSNTFTFIGDNFNNINIGFYSKPVITDIDGDGLLDLLIGEQDGNINHYKQNSVHSLSFTEITNDFIGNDVGSHSAPTITDLDGDGLLDLLIGEYDGNINHYEQSSENSTSFSFVTDNFNGIDVGNHSIPTVGDIDGDGLLELLIGNYDGKIWHYEQDSVNSTSFTLVTDNFNNIDVGEFSAPLIYDIDRDGLTDLLIGEDDSNINHYEQTACDSIGFGHRFTGSTYKKSYFVKAKNLSGNLNVSCPAGYNISLSENSGYSQSLSITPTNGRISDTVFVRFQPVTGQAYTGYITHTSTGADTNKISMYGYGVESTDTYSGTALSFDGTNDYVSIPNESDYDFTDSMTIEVWIKVNTFDKEWQAIITKGDNAWRLHRYSYSNHISFGTSGLSDGDLQGSTNVNDGKWHHIAAVYDGSHKYLYVDGNIDASASATGSIYVNDYPVFIGENAQQTGRYFNGMIDEVRIWNTARDSTQIREYMCRTLTGHETGLVSYWQMNDSTGNIAGEMINGNDGILTNMDTANCWVNSTAPVPFESSDDGNWSESANWLNGQGAPSANWSRVKINSNITLDQNMQLLELNINHDKSLNINTGVTLTVSDTLQGN